MFSFRLAGAIAAAALTATPTLAAAQPATAAASLSVARSATRAATPAGHGSRIAAGSTATLISIGILVAFTAIVLVATGDDDNDSPDSN